MYHDQPTILMGHSTGYGNAGRDYAAMKKYYTLFLVDITPVVERIALRGDDGLGDGVIPAQLVPESMRLARLAHDCASSTVYRRGQLKGVESTPPDVFCDQDIIAGYEALRQSAVENQGYAFLFRVPLLNLQKTVFKSSITDGASGIKEIIFSGIFFLRSLIVAAALCAPIFIRPLRSNIFILYTVAITLYISFIERQVEMRYLVQSDAVVSIYAAIVFCIVVRKFYETFRGGAGAF